MRIRFGGLSPAVFFSMALFSGALLNCGSSYANPLGVSTLRVQVDWSIESPREISDDPVGPADVKFEHYKVAVLSQERSGTPNLIAQTNSPSTLGSYRAVIKDAETQAVLGYDSIGTGKEYRKLTRAMTFRFPMPEKAILFEMFAENPLSGVLESVIRKRIELSEIQTASPLALQPHVRSVKPATQQPALSVVFYSESYLSSQEDSFWRAVDRAVQVLRQSNFPMLDRFEIRGVFVPSTETLPDSPTPVALGLPVPEGKTFLGLYYPYWYSRYNRWENVMYPTREDRFRRNIAVVPYDYPIILTHHSGYWGTGNFKELTVVPDQSTAFNYLMIHEFGHYFGLNEEYSGGGRTDLEFAPGTDEPWSQNITFWRSKDPAQLKWGKSGKPGTKGLVGAHRGCYGDSKPRGAQCYRPTKQCVMRSGAKFCPVCLDAIRAMIRKDLGEVRSVN